MLVNKSAPKSIFLIGVSNNMKTLPLKPHPLNPTAGFTLIEALAALAIFVVIVSATGSLFVQIVNLQRRALNIQRVDENAGFILETIAKEIRVGEVTDADSSCPATPANSLTINHPVNGTVVYGFSGQSLLRNGEALNSSLVKVTAVNFCVSGRSSGLQPRVTLWLTLQGGLGSGLFSRTVQTTVSQRVIKF